MSKLNHNATTISEAVKYMEFRKNQLLSIGYSNYLIATDNKAVIYGFYLNSLNNLISRKRVIAIYILKQHRGKGLYKTILDKYKDHTVITMKDCEITGYLDKIGKEYILAQPSNAYKIISKFYGDETAKRSGVKLINHINEGLYYLVHDKKASQNVLDAYCLHPIFQTLDNPMDYVKDYNISSEVINLCYQYKWTANSYLSTMKIDDFIGFPNEDVKDMLWADKVQNEKDFSIYHEDTHPRSKELRQYFDNWLNKLLI